MTNVFRKYGCHFASCLAMLLVLTPGVRAGTSNLSGEVTINVTVLAPPCDISEDDQRGITANFAPVSYRQFYNGSAGPQSDFALHLSNCDSSMAKSIHFTFSGTEEPSLPGMLALDPASGAKGVAIGIKSDNGTAININHPSDAFALSDGSMVFNFIAWLQATPEALANRNILPGDFSAQAVISLSYE